MKPVAWAAVAPGLLFLVSGCSMVAPRSEFDALQTQNRILQEQVRAKESELENLKVHTHYTEDQLANAEDRKAALEEQLGLSGKQLANYQQERKELHDQAKDMADAHLNLSPEVHRRLSELAERFPDLHFDPHTGVAKFDSDILFDSGSAELKPAANRVLAELMQVLRTPSAQSLKVFVVGHTDDRTIPQAPAHDQFASNIDLSTGRAQAVAGYLRQLGLEDQRLGVAGFGAHEPVTPNLTVADRQKNRRVEIFVMSPDVPVVGWTDSTPNMY